MEEFKGKRVIVSGAALGMGNLITRQFASDGASVLAADIDGEAVEKLASEANATGPGRVESIVADVEKYESVERAVALAVERFGGVDILINFAGGAPARVFGEPAPFWERNVRLLEWGINVNLRGALYYSRAVFPEMMKNPGGVIVNIGSIDGVTGSTAVEYSAAKKGVEGLTKALAVVGAPYQIRSVCVIPGPVLTRASMARMETLLGYAAEPRELTDFIRFLCSEHGRSITGSSHLVDGGRACGVISR